MLLAIASFRVPELSQQVGSTLKMGPARVAACLTPIPAAMISGEANKTSVTGSECRNRLSRHMKILSLLAAQDIVNQ